MTAEFYIATVLIVSISTIIVSAIISYHVFKKKFMKMSEEELQEYIKKSKKKNKPFNVKYQKSGK